MNFFRQFREVVAKGLIARKVIIGVVVFSSIITLATTSIQIALDYQGEVRGIDQRFDEIRNSNVRSIAQAVWVLDAQQINAQLTGLMNKPDIEFVAVLVNGKISWEAGSQQVKYEVSQFIPLTYTHLGRNMEIGLLEVKASMRGVYNRIINKILVILVSNAIKTFLVAGFLLFFFHYLVTRHLIDLSNYARRLGINLNTEPLTLSRKNSSKKSGDELDTVVEALNEMRDGLSKSYLDLEESKAFQRSLLESTFEGIYGLDRQGRVTFANPSTAEMLGVNHPNDLLGKNMHLAHHHSQANGTHTEPDECPIRRAYTVGDLIHRDDEVFWRADGTSFAAEYWAYPLWQKGQLLGAVVTFIDITARKQQEKMKDEFISTVSHELRTPVTSILGSLGIVLGHYQQEVPEEVKHMLQVAHRNSQHLVGLINDLLDVQRIAAGKLKLDLQPVPIGETVSEAISMNKAFAENHGVTLENITQSSGLVFADKDRVTQVLGNLLSNAAKFSPKGGRVEIKTFAIGANIRIEVSDKGPGIPDEFRGKIFQPFSQSDSTDTRVHGGTGLGLNISKALVNAMGGMIGFSTKVGEDSGSTFFFELPIHRERTEKSA